MPGTGKAQRHRAILNLKSAPLATLIQWRSSKRKIGAAQSRIAALGKETDETGEDQTFHLLDEPQ